MDYQEELERIKAYRLRLAAFEAAEPYDRMIVGVLNRSTFKMIWREGMPAETVYPESTLALIGELQQLRRVAVESALKSHRE